MLFNQTKIPGVLQLELEKNTDERGYFARTYCQSEFKKNGINFVPVQTSISYNKTKHTLRGMHLQKAPATETKLIQCVRGKIYDVILDLRNNSPTFCQWLAVELSEENATSLFVPAGCAHGFLTLTDHAEISYAMDVEFDANCASGYRWDDPVFRIVWPAEPKIISMRDQGWPDFKI